MDAQEKELKEIITPIIGNRRKFMLLRISDMGVDEALSICNVKKATYHSWLQDEVFTGIYRQRDALSNDYKQEAIKLLRRENQLAAVLLEGKVIEKIKEEVESGIYSIIKTHLAKEVYTKLIANLDYQPATLVENNKWENSTLYQLLLNQQKELTGGEAPQPIFLRSPDEQVIEATSSQEKEHPESILQSESEQTGSQT